MADGLLRHRALLLRQRGKTRQCPVACAKERGDRHQSHGAHTGRVLSSLAISLEKLKTEYVDILQLHNPDPLPDARDPDGAYGGLLEARERGQARFIGVSCHRLGNALSAAESGNYDTVQFPLSSLSSADDLRLLRYAKSMIAGSSP